MVNADAVELEAALPVGYAEFCIANEHLVLQMG